MRYQRIAAKDGVLELRVSLGFWGILFAKFLTNILRSTLGIRIPNNQKDIYLYLKLSCSSRHYDRNFHRKIFVKS